MPTPECPQQLPASAREVFEWLVKTYPRVDEQHTQVLAQASVLYASFLESPESFKAAQHNQLRQLYKEIRTIENTRKSNEEFEKQWGCKVI